MAFFQAVHKTLSQWKRAVFQGPSHEAPYGLETLSAEVILLIASKLSEEDRLALRQTSSRVCSAVGSNVSSLPITSVVAQHTLHTTHGAYGQRLNARFPQVRHLHCAVTGNVMRAFFQSCNGALLSVSSIDIACKSGLADSDLTLAAAACPRLCDLTIDAFAFTNPLQTVSALTQLTRLSLRLMRRSSLLIWRDEHLTHLHALPDLRALVLHSDGLLGSDGIEAITKLRSLHSLHLHHVHSLTGPDIKLLSRMRHLRTLVLNNCSVTSASHVSDLTTLPHLRSLSLQLHEAPLLPSSNPRPITYSSDFISELSSVPDLSSLTLQGYLDIHSNSSFHLPDLSSLTLQGPSTRCPSPSPTSSTSTAPHNSPPPRSLPPPTPPSPHSPISQLPSALSSLCLSRALRSLTICDWYYLSTDILSILPRFVSLETVKVACLPGLSYPDLQQLRPMRHLTALTLHTACNGLGPSASADVQKLLGRQAAFNVVEEPMPGSVFTIREL